MIVFFNVSRILLFNSTLKSNILETLKKQSLNVPVDCLINVANKQLTVNDLSTFIKVVMFEHSINVIYQRSKTLLFEHC